MRRLAFGLLGTAVAVHACSGPERRHVLDVIAVQGEDSDPLPGGNCLVFKRPSSSAAERALSVCAAPTDASRTVLSIKTGSAQCVRVMSREGRVAYFDAADAPTRDEVQGRPRGGQFSFIIDAAFPKTSGDPEFQSHSPAGAGGLGAESATNVFPDLLHSLADELSIDVYPEACDQICRQRDGSITLKLSAWSGVSGRENTRRLACPFVGPLSFARAAETGSGGEGGSGK